MGKFGRRSVCIVAVFAIGIGMPASSIAQIDSIWSMTYGDSTYGIVSIAPAADGGFVVAGNYPASGWITRMAATVHLYGCEVTVQESDV